jgi:hypothetical protein
MDAQQHGDLRLDAAYVSALDAIGRAYAKGLIATIAAGLGFAVFMYVPLVLRLLLRSH